MIMSTSQICDKHILRLKKTMKKIFLVEGNHIIQEENKLSNLFLSSRIIFFYLLYRRCRKKKRYIFLCAIYFLESNFSKILFHFLKSSETYMRYSENKTCVFSLLFYRTIENFIEVKHVRYVEESYQRIFSTTRLTKWVSRNAQDCENTSRMERQATCRSSKMPLVQRNHRFPMSFALAEVARRSCIGAIARSRARGWPQITSHPSLAALADCPQPCHAVEIMDPFAWITIQDWTCPGHWK